MYVLNMLKVLSKWKKINYFQISKTEMLAMLMNWIEWMNEWMNWMLKVNWFKSHKFMSNNKRKR